MNKSIIKNFSIYSRNFLINTLETNFENTKKRSQTIVEEIAYTWFARLITMYFLEVNNYQPYSIKVLKLPKKDSLKQVKDCIILDKSFKDLFIDSCISLNRSLPEMFEKVTEVEIELFPFSISNSDGVVYKLISDIPTSYFNIEDNNGIGQIEILGWMHQYYNTEKKNDIIDVIKKNRIKKEDIPFATQLFTNDWVVKYMVDNSLGRYWLERNPNSSIKESLEFLLPGEVEIINEKIAPEDLKIIDNAMGSGHMLIYTFDVMMKIYLSEGYSRSDAANLIIEKNLYGLEIDKSSYQLAYFSLMMKVRQNNPKAFDIKLNNNLEVFIELDDINIRSFDKPIKSLTDFKRLKALEQLTYLINTYKNSKEIGSLLVVKEVDEDLVLKLIEDAEINTEDISKINENIIKLLKINKMLLNKYTITVANPPYLNKFSPELKKYLNTNYNEYKKDLFSAFMFRNIELCKVGGYAAYMTPFVWMFINSYAMLRKYIIETKHISSLIQMEYSAFDDASVPICSFVLQNSLSEKAGEYIKLSDFTGRMNTQKSKVLDVINNPSLEYYYQTRQSEFKKIPGYPIAYWAGSNILKAFDKGQRLEKILDARQGMATGKNKEFLRYWWEVDYDDIVFDLPSFESYNNSFKGKYVPYNKGGQKRQWYGNYDYVIKFDQDNYNKLLKSGNHLPSKKFYFKEAITWGLISSGDFSIRYREAGSVHDVSGMSAFSDDSKTLKYILGLLSTPIANKIFKKLNPTLNLQVGDFKNFPVIQGPAKDEVVSLANKNIELAKEDWNLWETSWDFKSHFLVNNDKRFKLIADAYKYSKNVINKRFETLKINQEKLNKIFIELYGVESEVSANVFDKDITMTKIIDSKKDIYDDIKGNKYIKTKKEVIESFISFAVGCMFDRYSLDIEEYNQNNIFNSNVNFKITLSEEDIVTRFKDFVSLIFGANNLDENLVFIGNALDKKEEPGTVLQDYLIDDFYKNHLKTYKKKPIYIQSILNVGENSKTLNYVNNKQQRSKLLK